MRCERSASFGTKHTANCYFTIATSPSPVQIQSDCVHTWSSLIRIHTWSSLIESNPNLDPPRLGGFEFSPNPVQIQSKCNQSYNPSPLPWTHLLRYRNCVTSAHLMRKLAGRYRTIKGEFLSFECIIHIVLSVPGVPSPTKLSVDRQFTNSALISWRASPLPSDEIQGYNIYVDGKLKSQTKGSAKTNALVEDINPEEVSFRHHRHRSIDSLVNFKSCSS